MSIVIKSNILKNSDCYKMKRTITPKGIMVHSTASPGVKAKDFIKAWDKKGVTACVHAFVDDTGIYQTLPWNWRAWHCGKGNCGSGNNYLISFEICEPSGFYYTKGATMQNYDIEKNKDYFNKVYNNAVELCAYLCKKYNLTEKDIICHSEGHQKQIASNHADVMHWFPKHGKNMDIFREDVKRELNKNICINYNDNYDIYEVTVSVLNIRKGPSTDYPIVGKIKYKNMIQIEEIHGQWAKILGNGYVNIQYLKLIQPKRKVHNPSDFAKSSWEKAIIKGVFDGTSPQRDLTREETILALSRLNLF